MMPATKLDLVIVTNIIIFTILANTVSVMSIRLACIGIMVVCMIIGGRTGLYSLKEREKVFPEKTYGRAWGELVERVTDSHTMIIMAEIVDKHKLPAYPSHLMKTKKND